ncbi:MAG TPA: glycoside hydrolase family 32 protein, partial [Gemmata sp.]
APVRRVKFLVGQATVREFDIELATDGKPDFWATADVSAFRGKKLAVEVLLPPDVKLSALAVPSDKWADAGRLYQEKHRPLFHFTSRTGWLNDPNGLVFANGEWHLFYQHNPFGREWGNMHWGHATSTDLFRWKEQGIALYPKKYGDWAFSGSAVVDTANTSGWGTKEKPPLVLAYTSTGRGECIAFSTDNGKTWTEHDQNPVVKHAGRDPKLIWHEKAKHWVMAVYDEAEKKQWIAFYTSPDLKTWTFASRIEGFFECPDLFELPVREVAADPRLPDARPQRTRWVLYAADGKYVTGDFDGKVFKPEHEGKRQLWYGNFYAAQTFDHAPKRRVQIGWAQGVTFPGTAFNQQMTVPVELTLHSRGADGGPRLSAAPVSELASLRDGKPVFESKPQEVKKPLVLVEDADALDISLDVHWRAGGAFTLDVRGTKIVFDPTKWTLTCKGVTVPLVRDVAPGGGGTVRLRVLVDRGSVEVFTGETALSAAVVHDEKNRKVEFVPQGGLVMVGSAGIYRLKSAWEK